MTENLLLAEASRRATNNNETSTPSFVLIFMNCFSLVFMAKKNTKIYLQKTHCSILQWTCNWSIRKQMLRIFQELHFHFSAKVNKPILVCTIKIMVCALNLLSSSVAYKHRGCIILHADKNVAIFVGCRNKFLCTNFTHVGRHVP